MAARKAPSQQSRAPARPSTTRPRAAAIEVALPQKRQRSPAECAYRERFVGWLTIAIGLAMFVPRPGLGLYSVLSAAGDRVSLGAFSLFAGSLQVLIVSMCGLCGIRIAVALMSLSVWAVLGWHFVDAALWGGFMQSVVIMAFASGSAYDRFVELRDGN